MVGKAFKVYIGVLLFLITGLLAVLTAVLIIVGLKLHDTTNRVNTFSQKADSIDSSLKAIQSDLQTYNRGSSLPNGFHP